MGKIDYISFNTHNYELNSSDSSKKVFYINDYDDLIVNYFDLPPDITAKDDSEKSLQDNYRNVAVEAGGAIIEVSKLKIDSYTVLKTIFKFKLSPSGVVYIGSYTIPFEKCSYVIKIQCPEIGTTGVRDSTVFELALKKGLVEISNKTVKGWMKDPYDENIDLPYMMNLSEKEEYDKMFPEHPLNRLRKYLLDVEKTISIDKKLKDETKYIFGANKNEL